MITLVIDTGFWVLPSPQAMANFHQLDIQLREQKAEAERRVAELEQVNRDLEVQLKQQQARLCMCCFPSCSSKEY